MPAISFAGLHASASPILNSNSVYMSYAAAPHVLHPAESIYSVHKQESTECGFVASPHLRLAAAIKAGLHLESLALASAKIAFVYFTAIYRC